MKDFTFYNVRITLKAATAAEAYEKLCKLLIANGGVDYETDTYSGGEDEVIEHPTIELWPELALDGSVR